MENCVNGTEGQLIEEPFRSLHGEDIHLNWAKNRKNLQHKCICHCLSFQTVHKQYMLLCFFKRSPTKAKVIMKAAPLSSQDRLHTDCKCRFISWKLLLAISWKRPDLTAAWGRDIIEPLKPYAFPWQSQLWDLRTLILLFLIFLQRNSQSSLFLTKGEKTCRNERQC